MTPNNSYRIEAKRSWWYRFLRAANYFCFRNWWWLFLLFLIFIVLWLLFCCNPCSKTNNCDCYKKQIDSLENVLENCCDCDPANDPRLEDRTDSLRDSLGGQVGDITVTLTWDTKDDLDLLLIEPSNDTIYFNHKKSPNGGELDIDRNNETPLVTNPIENIYYEKSPPAGEYQVLVLFYKKRSNKGIVPFNVQLRIEENVSNYQGKLTFEKEFVLVKKFTYPMSK